MTAVILTVHTLIVLALIGVVLLQRSDGGALGLGGGGGGGGFMSGRGAANALTRTTSILAALFFATSLSLAIFADSGGSDDTAIDELTGAGAPAPAEETAPLGATTTDDLLNSLGGDTEDAAEESAVSPEQLLDALGGEDGSEQEAASPMTETPSTSEASPEETDDPEE